MDIDKPISGAGLSLRLRLKLTVGISVYKDNEEIFMLF